MRSFNPNEIAGEIISVLARHKVRASALEIIFEAVWDEVEKQAIAEVQTLADIDKFEQAPPSPAWGSEILEKVPSTRRISQLSGLPYATVLDVFAGRKTLPMLRERIFNAVMGIGKEPPSC